MTPATRTDLLIGLCLLAVILGAMGCMWAVAVLQGVG